MVGDLSREFEKSRKEKKISEEARLKIGEIKKQAEVERKEKQEAQKDRRDQDLAKERQKIIEKKAQLKYQPPGARKDPDKGEVEKQAIRNLADTNRKELSAIEKNYQKEIEKVLAKEQVPVKKEFNRSHEHHEGRER